MYIYVYVEYRNIHTYISNLFIHFIKNQIYTLYQFEISMFRLVSKQLYFMKPRYFLRILEYHI